METPDSVSLKTVIAWGGAIAAVLGLFSQLDTYVVTEAEMSAHVQRLDTHIERSNENLKDRQAWRDKVNSKIGIEEDE